MPKSRCEDLEKKNHCLVIEKDHTSLLSIKTTRDFRNMIMAIECIFSKISKDSVGNG
jgi:hypothetical protein